MKNLHLVCNAHLDPVWLWELEEGVAETLSTFRVAADFCEEYGGFVFNHNESILYEWIEEHDPELFKRIQKLVKDKKWHIMGGWYLQPDCNMPSGESFVRQILAGKYYFMDKFGVEPTTCINFDAFGHNRGLVEILKKSNYDSYLFCRPEPDMLDLPGEDFAWVGYQGSKINAHRAFNSYESHRGRADEKIKDWMEAFKGNDVGLVLWGIGNHGGGPSRIDYEKIEQLKKDKPEYNIIHSTPEEYFEELIEKKGELPEYEGILNPRYIGCYTSQIRIKQLHRKLENEIYSTEKMMAHSAFEGYFEYSYDKLQQAIKDLLLVEFHDILPGSAIPQVEEYSIGLAGHGLEEAKRLKTKSFFALCSGLEKAKDGEIPIIAYNPHPYKVKGIFECEFQLPDQNWSSEFAFPEVYKDGKRIPCQVEDEYSNFNVDWRKHSVFEAELEPGQINRFDVKIVMIPEKQKTAIKEENGVFKFKTDDLYVEISAETGTIDKYVVDGKDFIEGKGFLPLVINDDENSWAHKEKHFRNVAGNFEVMNKKEGSIFSGVEEKEIESVRVIEDGEVRTIIEAVMKYENSFICQRYHLPKRGTEIKITTKVYWNEKMKMLKLSIPTALSNGQYFGQEAYGSEQLLDNGNEMVSQKWNLVADDNHAVSIINNGTYGSDFKDGEMRISLLRSPGYSAGKSDFTVRHPYIMAQDRFSPFIDQGERSYEFYFNAGDKKQRRTLIERESLNQNEKPMVLSFFPTGAGKKSKPFAMLSDDAIVLSAFKKCERSDDYIIRLFNPTDENRTTNLAIPPIDFRNDFELEGYEIKSFRLNPETKEVKLVDLMEREI